MTATEHAHYRFSGTPMGNGIHAWECQDCDHTTVGTTEQIVAAIRASHDCTPELVQSGPDGDLRVGLVAAVSVLTAAGAVVPFVFAAFTGSAGLWLTSVGMFVAGLVGLRWAWRNGVER